MNFSYSVINKTKKQHYSLFLLNNYLNKLIHEYQYLTNLCYTIFIISKSYSNGSNSMTFFPTQASGYHSCSSYS
jgi:hypothetical protein